MARSVTFWKNNILKAREFTQVYNKRNYLPFLPYVTATFGSKYPMNEKMKS